jgi:hypothetical protein
MKFQPHAVLTHLVLGWNFCRLPWHKVCVVFFLFYQVHSRCLTRDRHRVLLRSSSVICMGLFFIHNHTFAHVFTKFGIMAEDLPTEILDSCIRAGVWVQANLFLLYALSKKDNWNRDNSVVVSRIWGKAQTIFAVAKTWGRKSKLSLLLLGYGAAINLLPLLAYANTQKYFLLRLL